MTPSPVSQPEKKKGETTDRCSCNLVTLGTLGPLHGRILVTIVRVTHIQVGTSPMTIPQGNNLPLGANRMQ
jgi:hypothetical protein